MEIIKLYHEIKNPSISLRPSIKINKYWLGGFVDGDGTFSAGQNRPRFKFENHVKELPLRPAGPSSLGPVFVFIRDKNKNKSETIPIY